MLAPQKESIFGCSCRLWLLSWRRARVFARSCSLLSKYLPISWKQRKEQSHAQCHVTHRIRIFDKISEHVKVAKSVDIAVPELAVTVDCCCLTIGVADEKKVAIILTLARGSNCAALSSDFAPKLCTPRVSECLQKFAETIWYEFGFQSSDFQPIHMAFTSPSSLTDVTLTFLSSHFGFYTVRADIFLPLFLEDDASSSASFLFDFVS